MSFGFLINFLKDAVAEVSNVTWPSKSEVYAFFIVVFVMLLILATFFLCVDTVLANIVNYILR